MHILRWEDPPTVEGKEMAVDGRLRGKVQGNGKPRENAALFPWLQDREQGVRLW